MTIDRSASRGLRNSVPRLAVLFLESGSLTPADTPDGEPCLPTTLWFLASEAGKPMGQTYGPPPRMGHRMERPDEVRGWTVASFEELRPTCAMRRFRVVVRPPVANEGLR